MAWITVQEAARRLGYQQDAFRRKFCDPHHPAVGIRDTARPGARRRVLEVWEEDIEALEQETVKRPA